VFPAGDGRANVGLGVGVLGDRSAGRRVAHDLGAFVAHAAKVGVLAPHDPRLTGRSLGAWLKMGIVGTTPARDRVFLVGDAAGLVNPLQGEGIAQAMDTGRAAAHAILVGEGRAADLYRTHLAGTQGRYLSTTASLQRTLLHNPRVVAGLTRTMTAPGVGAALAGGWSIMWNNLLDGASPGLASGAARIARGLGYSLTARSSDRRWISQQLLNPPHRLDPGSRREHRSRHRRNPAGGTSRR
jgi:flavin-dependent dehydrogenase